MGELILIVDDEPGILTALSGVLNDEGYQTLCTQSGEEALKLYEDRQPSVVFLDIWLPDRDGLETLQALRELDPAAAVIMMSGHGTASTAVKAIKMGAFDYVEKPISYNQVVESVAGALEYRQSLASDASLLSSLERTKARLEQERILTPAPELPLLQQGTEPQRTIRKSTVLYGLGLHSGRRTGMAIQPLPPDSGIHFVTLPANTHIPAYVSEVAETDYATTLSRNGDRIRTVEHLLSALHAYGVTNLLIKVHGEIPVLDGSALEFCKSLEDVGVEDQDRARKELVIDRCYEVGDSEDKRLTLEPAEGFSVSYLLRYPPPIGEQSYEFQLTGPESYREEIAPARTFGFMRDMKMMNELGLASGGRLDNCILVGEDNVMNTELRFADEFVRHKILDIIGDLYLLGYPIRGRVTARLTGHRNNIALLRSIREVNS
jgi:UDP-3-O-[3-hydroxymyristoyl] N-acetylglucosamine deacetylase